MSALVLHVGLHKTGTTTVQCSLDTAREELRKTNVRVFRGRNHGELYRAFTERPECFHRFYRSWGCNARQTEIKNQIRREFVTHEEVTHIVCSEDLSLLSADALNKMKNFLRSECGVSEINVVCVLRNPLDYLNSILQQYIKPGLVTLDDVCTRRFPGFAYQGVQSDRTWDYQGILEALFFSVPVKLVQVFGTDAVKFLNMDASKESGLTHSVLSAAGIYNPSIQENRMNPSMSHEACILLGEYNNRHPLFTKKKDYNPARQKSSAHIRFLRALPGERPLLLDQQAIDHGWLQRRIKELNGVVGGDILDPAAKSTSSPTRGDLLHLSERTAEHLNKILGWRDCCIDSGSLTRLEVGDLGRRLERDYTLPKRIRKALMYRARLWL